MRRSRGVIGRARWTSARRRDFTWGIKKLELALVLDNTGSMTQSGKLHGTQDRLHNLLNTLKAPPRSRATSRSRSFRSTPMVNIGTGFKDEPGSTTGSRTSRRPNGTDA